MLPALERFGSQNSQLGNLKRESISALNGVRGFDARAGDISGI
jgi:hypothetical protein